MAQQFSGVTASAIPQAISNLRGDPYVRNPLSGPGKPHANPVMDRYRPAPIGGIGELPRDQYGFDPWAGQAGHQSGSSEYTPPTAPEVKNQADADAINEKNRAEFDQRLAKVQDQREYRTGRRKSYIPWAVNIPEDPIYSGDVSWTPPPSDSINIGIENPHGGLFTGGLFGEHGNPGEIIPSKEGTLPWNEYSPFPNLPHIPGISDDERD